MTRRAGGSGAAGKGARHGHGARRPHVVPEASPGRAVPAAEGGLGPQQVLQLLALVSERMQAEAEAGTTVAGAQQEVKWAGGRSDSSNANGKEGGESVGLAAAGASAVTGAPNGAWQAAAAEAGSGGTVGLPAASLAWDVLPLRLLHSLIDDEGQGQGSADDDEVRCGAASTAHASDPTCRHTTHQCACVCVRARDDAKRMP